MTHELTIQEFYESLNGFDEIAIEKAFGYSISECLPDEDTGQRGDQSKFARALIFVAERRGGLKDGEAHNAAMQKTLKEVSGYFTDPPEELDDEDPETPEGKDEPEPMIALAPSPSGASAPASALMSTSG